MTRLAAFLVAAVVAAASCGSAATSSPRSIPAAPEPPSGWVSVGGIGGVGGQGFVAAAMTLGGRATALNVACIGTGTVIVLVGKGQVIEGAQSAAVFRCDYPSSKETRYELTGLPIPDQATVSAWVVEGAGALVATAFFVSVEQPAPEPTPSQAP